MTGDVWMKREVLGHLGRGHTLALSREQVDLPPGAVTERRGDRGHRRREALVGDHRSL